jgi:S-DNA-T family DNA segregation ATPase FtsK/SpoIIIE
MNLLGPTRYPRLNEAAAIVCLLAAFFVLLSLASYRYQDPSWDTVTGLHARNLIGPIGASIADVLLQLFGLAAYAIPGLMLALAWKWLCSSPVAAPWAKAIGAVGLLLGLCTAFGLGPEWHPVAGVLPASGLLGTLLAEYLDRRLNTTGAILLTAAVAIISLYLVSSFTVGKLAIWFAGPIAWWNRTLVAFGKWRAERVRIAAEKERLRAEERARKRALAKEAAAAEKAERTARTKRPRPEIVDDDAPPFDMPDSDEPQQAAADELDDIPIRELEPSPPVPLAAPPAPVVLRPVLDSPPKAQHHEWVLPSTTLLNEPAGRSIYDTQELKDIAARIKSKFEEFAVHGSVVQINPGPVVTTFEFKPEAGIKYSRITTLTEDLCLGLQAESILIERIPGKPTVGIEVPNTRREVISLRQILESDEFRSSPSPLTIPLGKDISGRIRVSALETMPHLLIAGSTGSGKSVMLNSMIMSILFKSTPDEVRMIMVDPKRLELGLYEGIPHLLTPVITDPKKATNALRNAVLEMERRLKLLAAQGVRNIDQYNRKIRQLQLKPRSLFDEADAAEELETLPYILILIDELADLMMLERANVEESVARLAQMARAVGMHLVLATQRPSVDVITGLIKANFPSRISFRVATRVDSRTVLDVMGAEHLLGKGDMLFLPPGSSRLTRVHGAYLTESEINDVVEFWKEQATPEYDKSFLLPPPEESGDGDPEDFEGDQDPLYQDAVRVVLELGKASTSTLQRRLRLGYGRAARILDMMQREGIIGPPDGPRPREVLKRPDWLQEVEGSLR